MTDWVREAIERKHLSLTAVHLILGSGTAAVPRNLEKIILDPIGNGSVKIYDIHLPKAIEQGLLLKKTNNILQLHPTIFQQIIEEHDYSMLIDLYQFLLDLRRDDPKVLWAQRIDADASEAILKPISQIGTASSTNIEFQISNMESYVERIINILIGKETPPEWYLRKS